MIRAGKKPVIIAVKKCSLAHIFLERDMDYILVDTLAQTNVAAAKVIMEDKHDFVVVYNGNFDYRMHRSGCETPETLSELRGNSQTFAMLSELVKQHWQSHNTFMGFAMDHGCHEIDEGCGSHGLDMPEDLNIVHRYGAYPAE